MTETVDNLLLMSEMPFQISQTDYQLFTQFEAVNSREIELS